MSGDFLYNLLEIEMFKIFFLRVVSLEISKSSKVKFYTYYQPKPDVKTYIVVGPFVVNLPISHSTLFSEFPDCAVASSVKKNSNSILAVNPPPF